ncbi:MAG: glycine betaine catabolism, partial [Actinomycetota bacterium]|nr:glycine betaine catabolism [Actinomycetota bacterium]
MTALQAALPAPYYVDDAHWRREREQVLRSSWFCAGRLSSYGLPAGSVQRVAVVDVAGESVLVTRDTDGALRAFYNVCRHRGSQVVPVDPAVDRPAPCAAASLRCPYHSWTYDLEGRLLRAPHTEDVDDFDPTEFGLHPV